MKSKQIISIVILLIVFSAGSFFAGTKYQQSKIRSGFNKQMTTSDQKGFGTGNRNGTQTGKTNQNPGANIPNIGEITKVDDSSITIKTMDGSSKIILISDSTVYKQSTSAAKTDLKVGSKVEITGDQNTDGSVTGKNISISPVIK